jgi:hypothetical protein
MVIPVANAMSVAATMGVDDIAAPSRATPATA